MMVGTCAGKLVLGAGYMHSLVFSIWRGGGRIFLPRGIARDDRKGLGRVMESVDISTSLSSTWMMHT